MILWRFSNDHVTMFLFVFKKFSYFVILNEFYVFMKICKILTFLIEGTPVIVRNNEKVISDQVHEYPTFWV